MDALSLVGATSLKGKNVKLKYIHPNSVARVLIAEFNDIWVDIPPWNPSVMVYNWSVVQGIVYKDQLTAIPESEIADSNMPIRFTMEFTLENIEYKDKDYLVETEPIEVGLGWCSAMTKAFTFGGLPTDKVIFVTQWEGQGGCLWRLDGKKWK
jgi:hypothetical protein